MVESTRVQLTFHAQPAEVSRRVASGDTLAQAPRASTSYRSASTNPVSLSFWLICHVGLKM